MEPLMPKRRTEQEICNAYGLGEDVCAYAKARAIIETDKKFCHRIENGPNSWEATAVQGTIADQMECLVGPNMSVIPQRRHIVIVEVLNDLLPVVDKLRLEVRRLEAEREEMIDEVRRVQGILDPADVRNVRFTGGQKWVRVSETDNTMRPIIEGGSS